MSAPILLVASFGSTRVAAAERSLGALERHLSRRFPDWDVRRCHTSGTVCARLGKTGIMADTAEQALSRAVSERAESVFLLPTHFARGVAHERLRAATQKFSAAIKRLRMGEALVQEPADARKLARALAAAHEAEAGCGQIYFGHGSGTDAHSAYGILEEAFRAIGRNDVRVVAGEASRVWRDLRDLRGAARIVVRPLTLIAGESFFRGVAAGSRTFDSLRKSGVEVTIADEGLGEIFQVRALYAAKAATLGN